MTDLLWKVLNEDGTAQMGVGKWSLPNGKPGAWKSVKGELIPCANGLHLCRRGDLVRWLGPAIFEAEYAGKLVEARDKVVVRKARLIRKLDGWNERTARLYTADCAERVLPIFERRYPDDGRPRAAIEVARRFARGKATREELAAAAEAAARAAWVAEAADWVTRAARAAWAARAAGAAGAADWATRAARAASWAAGAAGARVAEREWQTDRLFQYLEGQA